MSDPPTTISTTIAAVGLIATSVGACVSLFNSWKQVRWKRAELANSYLRDFNQNDELVFFGRCLDWYGGQLIVPEKLRAFIGGGECIEHDRATFERALSNYFEFDDLRGQFQLYRTACDTFLAWLSLISGALDRRLFMAEDIADAAYWARVVRDDRALHAFVNDYYKESIDKLLQHFYKWHSYDSSWLKPLGDDELAGPVRKDSDTARLIPA